jgi:DNA polymerase-3 subunit alpha
MGRAAAIHRDKMNGQEALFGGMSEPAHVSSAPAEVYGDDVEDFSREELLAMERELLGLYVSDHPLKQVRELLENKVSVTSDQIQELADERECIIGGLITDVRYHTTKRSGDRMAFIKIEDLAGTISVTVFPSVFKQCENELVVDQVVLIKGKASHRERLGRSNGSEEEKSYQVEVLAESVTKLADSVITRKVERQEEEPTIEIIKTSAIHIRLQPKMRKALADLKVAMGEHPGDCKVYIHIADNGNSAKVRTGCLVAPTSQFMAAICDIVGSSAVWTE